VTADLLNYRERDAWIARLREGCAAEAVSASSFNADSLAGFSEDSGDRVARKVSPVRFGVATWE
jgi:hypothetical protein